jgi:hypothetical protein
MRMLLLVCAFTLVGCTTMETVERSAVPTVLADLEVGDQISVRVAGTWEDFSVVGVSDASVRLERRRGESVTLAREDMSDIRVRRRTPGKTAALAAGIFFGSMYALCGNPFESDGC